MVQWDGAGHSKEIVKRINGKGLLVGIDRDEEAICVAKERLNDFKNIIFVHGNHDDIKNILEEQNISEVDGILLDLGVSSYQLDERNRGFSYMGDAILDMRMDKSQTITAKDIINKYSEEELARIIFEYGEERYSRKIAKKIVEQRKSKEIETTGELVDIIKSVVPFSKGDGHPAKRTFQAIRIEVNDEIKPLYNTIIDCIDCLKSGGRLCVLTFHSLEDRAVKNAFIDCVRKMHLSTRTSILCMWCKIKRKNNYKKTNITNAARNEYKFKKQKCKTKGF